MIASVTSLIVFLVSWNHDTFKKRAFFFWLKYIVEVLIKTLVMIPNMARHLEVDLL